MEKLNNRARLPTDQKSESLQNYLPHRLRNNDWVEITIEKQLYCFVIKSKNICSSPNSSLASIDKHN